MTKNIFRNWLLSYHFSVVYSGLCRCKHMGMCTLTHVLPILSLVVTLLSSARLVNAAQISGLCPATPSVFKDELIALCLMPKL